MRAYPPDLTLSPAELAALEGAARYTLLALKGREMPALQDALESALAHLTRCLTEIERTERSTPSAGAVRTRQTPPEPESAA